MKENDAYAALTYRHSEALARRDDVEVTRLFGEVCRVERELRRDLAGTSAALDTVRQDTLANIYRLLEEERNRPDYHCAMGDHCDCHSQACDNLKRRITKLYPSA
jgi:hypothetical protein